jgi:hypothetical protein
MCYYLDVMLDCFCDSRVVERLTNYTPDNSSNNIITNCVCDKVFWRSFHFGLCTICHNKIIRIRRNVKTLLLSFQRQTFFDTFYHHSVSMYVQRQEEINF